MHTFKLRFFSAVFLLSTMFLQPLRADEGMWLPQLLQQMNAPEMRLKGLQIPIEEIYNVNKRSLKDAVVLFGGGCTGEIISEQGLLLTNHHCGFSQIQDNSTLEHNYLRDGFWAKTLNDEIPCPGLTVSFIVRIDDVTDEFDKLLRDDMTEQQRNGIIKDIAQQVEKKAVEGTTYEAKVKQFFSGNKFFLIVSETFKDVRMVGAPPSSIGKFGGDTDNWMWPRHNADFSLFRVYANKDNHAAPYSKDNVPFHPKYSFSINLSGVQENDFTMVYGFPGRTQEYLSSYSVEHLLKVTDPNRVKVRDERLRIMDEAMRSSEALHIKYAAKQSTVSNGWKKWKGEMLGLNKSNAIQKKRDKEIDFTTWVNSSNESTKTKYGSLLPAYAKLYNNYRPYLSANDYYSEAVFGIELINFANSLRKIHDVVDDSLVANQLRDTKKGLPGFYKNYDVATDKRMMGSLLAMFDAGVPDSLKPADFINLRSKYKGDFVRLAEVVFHKTELLDSTEVNEMLSMAPRKFRKELEEDAAYKLTDQLAAFYAATISVKATAAVNELARLDRLFMEAQMEMDQVKKFYPDANSTLRLAYGQVRG